MALYSIFRAIIVENYKMYVLMEWHSVKQDFIKVHKPEKIDDWSDIIWHNGTTTIPSDSPICGWMNELCKQEGNNIQLTVILILSISGSLALGVLAFVFVKRYMYETNLKKIGDIKISWDDLVAIDYKDRDINTSVYSINAPKSLAHATHCGNLQLVLYNDTFLFVKSLGNTLLNIEDHHVLMDLNKIRELAHDNVNRFIGICTEIPHVCYLMAYASRGSLQDIIANDDINLSMDFKVSFILDIACGMWYLLQSPIEAHGSLTSSKCIIDNRWTCKITGHGLKYIKAQYGLTRNHHNNQSRLLWTAPELLCKKTSDVHSSSQYKQGDVFSFSIIAQEVFLKDVPYAANAPELDADTIIARVKEQESPPYRPVIPSNACNEKWAELIQICWSEDPQQRPTFEDILLRINSIHRYKNMDLVDNMVKRLERYTNTLEESVIIRSLQLQEEKHKVDVLLRELLPSSVAQSLALGHQVAPEAFDNVTIFFSDIVGFTRISAVANPLEIVDMLNSMYTMFDDLAQRYDVYKVATIGDAYMVASGVPIRNGHNHAREICALSLALLNAIEDFPIAHLPGEHLSMRIGIFSGPCVAGVAGIKMPRYLLFGDTVDIAAKMESLGEAMKVHIGHSTMQLIKTDQQFQLKLRGQMELKGNVKVETYWLEKQLA